MTHRLTGMGITRVSLVDKGANARRFAVLKRDEEGPMPDATVDLASAPVGVISWLRKQLGFPEPVAKAETFATVIAGQQLEDALDGAFWTLRDVLWSAFYAWDHDTDAPMSLEGRRALVVQDLDEFKTYLLGRMDQVVEKRDTSPAARDRAALAAVVAKAAAATSGSPLERLQAAAEALTSVLDEVNEAKASETAGEAEEVPVEKADIIAAMTEALEPVTKRLDALEAKPIVKTEPVTKGGDGEAGDGEEVTLATVVDVIEKLADRLEVVEGGHAVRKSLESQDGAEGGGVKKRSTFAGILS